MKHFTLLLSVLVIATEMTAQDVIVKKDGSTVISKVLSVGTDVVEYKKFSNLEGPTYKIAVSELQAINYQNGDKDVFNQAPAESSPKEESNNAPSVIMLEASGLNEAEKSANERQIAAYSASLFQFVNNEKKSKDANRAFMLYGVKDNSVMSNQDVEISFETGSIYQEKKTEAPEFLKERQANSSCYNPGFIIRVTNKTSQALYIDLANSFFSRLGQSILFKIGPIHSIVYT